MRESEGGAVRTLGGDEVHFCDNCTCEFEHECVCGWCDMDEEGLNGIDQ